MKQEGRIWKPCGADHARRILKGQWAPWKRNFHQIGTHWYAHILQHLWAPPLREHSSSAFWAFPGPSMQGMGFPNHGSIHVNSSWSLRTRALFLLFERTSWPVHSHIMNALPDSSYSTVASFWIRESSIYLHHVTMRMWNMMMRSNMPRWSVFFMCHPRCCKCGNTNRHTVLCVRRKMPPVVKVVKPLRNLGLEYHEKMHRVWSDFNSPVFVPQELVLLGGGHTHVGESSVS